MLMNPRRIYAAFAIFLKKNIFKDYFWNYGEMCCNFINFIVTDEKLILYQYIIITKNYV